MDAEQSICLQSTEIDISPEEFKEMEACYSKCGIEKRGTPFGVGYVSGKYSKPVTKSDFRRKRKKVNRNEIL